MLNLTHLDLLVLNIQLVFRHHPPICSYRGFKISISEGDVYKFTTNVYNLWCSWSNLYIYNQTSDINLLDHDIDGGWLSLFVAISFCEMMIRSVSKTNRGHLDGFIDLYKGFPSAFCIQAKIFPTNMSLFSDLVFPKKPSTSVK